MDEKIYDANHKYVGRRTKDFFGNDVIKDVNDKVVARYGEDMLGNKVVRNASGKVTGVFGQDMLGNSVVLDPGGKVKQRYGYDMLGNEAMTDANGRVIGYTESANVAQAAPSYPMDDDDDRPLYRVVNGRKIYPGSDRLEKALAKEVSKYLFPAYASYLLPALYCAAAIFVKQLPAFPALMIGLLTAGIFLSSLFGRAADIVGKGWQIGTFFISLLIYSVWFVVFTTYRTVWNVSEKEELITILAGPVLFLLAELIGGLIGHGIYKSARKRIYKLK